MDKSDITAVILAGGKGRRLGGQDKGLVSYNGKKLIEHVLERIQSQVGDILINANRNQSVYAEYGYPVINDSLSNFQGPLAGFSIAMQTATTEYIVTLPCDGPNFPHNLVTEMISGLGDKTNSVAVAFDGKRMQPVYALIPVSLHASLQQFLTAGERKIDLWYASVDTVLIDFSKQPEAFFNVNTSHDL